MKNVMGFPCLDTSNSAFCSVEDYACIMHANLGQL